MKRFICLLLTTIILLSCTSVVFAETTDSEAPVEKAILEITLTEAKSIAVQNSRQFSIDTLEIAAKEAAVKQAQEDADSVPGGIAPTTALRDRVTVQVKVREAETNLKLAKIAQKNNTIKLEADVEVTFYNVLLAQKELELELKKLDFVKERCEMAKSRYEAKTITKDDLEMAEYNLYSKNIEIEVIKDKIRMLDMKLKDQLGLPLDGDMLKLKGTIEAEKADEIDINKLVAQNIGINSSIYAAAERYAAAAKTMELTSELFKQGSETYDNNMVSMESALRDYEAEKRNREVEIRNTYNDLLNLVDSAQLAEMYEELLKKRLDNVKIKFEKGQVSREIYMDAEEAYENAVFDNIKAKCNLNIERLDFNNIVSM